MTLREIRIPNFAEYKLRIDSLLSSYKMMKGKHKEIPYRFKKSYFEARRKEGTKAYRLIKHYKKYQINLSENRKIEEMELISKATKKIVFELSKNKGFAKWFKEKYDIINF